MNLSQYLRKRSKEICADNECTEEQHNCKRCAYINEDLELLNICISDYFQGYNKPYATILLPWTGTYRELKQEVAEQVFEQK